MRHDKYILAKNAYGKAKRKVALQKPFKNRVGFGYITRIKGLSHRWFPYSEARDAFGHKYFDHMTTHFDLDGTPVVESQPYCTEEEAKEALTHFCESYDLEMSFGQSDWNPPATISIEFRKKTNPRIDQDQEAA